MPNRTIYVADADVPVYEKAQKLAGDNLSAAIAHALRIFVEREEARQSGYEDVTIKVGKGRPYLQKQFRGRLIAKRKLNMQNDARQLTMNVYQTAKGRYAVYTRSQPNWAAWSQGWSKQPWRKDWANRSDWKDPAHDWTTYYEDDEHRLDVYDTLEQLKEQVPEELFDAISRYLKGDEVEFLDI